MTKKKKNTLLWKIEGEKVQAPCYLFGTMHVKDKRAFLSNDVLLKKIEKCSVFAAEFDLAEVDASKIAQSMRLPQGQGLSDLLRPKYYAKLDVILQKNCGIALKALEHNKPLLILNLLTEAQFKADRPEALDHFLYEFAKEKGLQTTGIETFDEQLNILGKIPLHEQMRSLIWTIKNIKSFRRQLKKTADLYAKMDLNRLNKAVKRQAKGMRKPLLYERNKLMANRIGKIIKKDATFIAIGAGHLSGGKGVLRLLKKKGFNVKPIRLK